jgi:DUF4097 and DUF4098 domain-containing protein YvlB
MEQIRTVTREFATGDKAVLHLESRSGSVITEGRDIDRVVVEATVHVWTDISAEADDAAILVERNMEQDGHRVIVRAPSLRTEEGRSIFSIVGWKSSRVDYLVRVPRRTAVRVLSRSGSVQIAHVEGIVHTEAMSGRIGLDDVRGDVTAVSRSGSLSVERIAGDLSVDARSGKVRIKGVAGKAAVEARSGTLEVEDVGGDVRVTSRAGSVSVANVGGKLYARTRAGSMRYRGRVCDDMDIEAHAGSITLAVDPDFPFFIDAESSVGSVRSDLPPRRNGSGPAAGGPRVRLRSHAGSIRLTRD